ncbi:MAG: S24 family peptidase [Sulfuricellaceae bacterium]|nr:S24 family peptidase [Sulfuricellaceae bacterium]
MSQKKTIPIFDASENADEALSACSSGEPYALLVLGDSMLPEFEDGEVIVVEPEGLARDGSYVVAYHNDEYTFRQLLNRDGKWFLQPLNDLYPTEEIPGMEVVKGVVIQKKKPGKRSSFKSYV